MQGILRNNTVSLMMARSRFKVITQHTPLADLHTLHLQVLSIELGL